MAKVQLTEKFSYVISVNNLLEAWREFAKGKRGKKDVQEFYGHLMDNIFDLHYDLAKHTYKHGGYQAFNIFDPKPRSIHKASVRDRLLHHALYRVLSPFFNNIFIADSYSCRLEKGTHRALNRFRSFIYKVGKNNTKTCWVLKCDIKKFFANIDHKTLMEILESYIPDKNILWLLEQVIVSFLSTGNITGLPLGNLTSQLLVNVYMNEFDHFVKDAMRVKYYIRYADDFVLLSNDRNYLRACVMQIGEYLKMRLKLSLHPNKIFIKTASSGVDFLGWVNFEDHRVIRPVTKRRAFKKMAEATSSQTDISYRGLMKHGNTNKIQSEMFEFRGKNPLPEKEDLDIMH